MIGRLAATAVALAILAVVSAAPAAAVPPRVGTFVSAPLKGSPDKMKLEVVKKRGALRTRLLQLKDDCASGFLYTPIGLGLLAGNAFQYRTSGGTTSTGYSLTLDGSFTSGMRASARVQSSKGDLFPPPGTPPGTANICSDDTTFALRFLPDGL